MKLLLALLVLLAANDPQTLYRNGASAFERGEIEASVAAFDQLVELQPKSKPSLWQRGISLFYAGRYEDCVDQFVAHRTVNGDDAENSVWHYLCVAQLEGHEAAQSALFPADDSRIPLMTIHRLFAGEASIEELLAAAGDQRVPQFYAHLYAALWYESHQNREKTIEHLKKALDGPQIGHYMEVVAEVHLKRLL